LIGPAEIAIWVVAGVEMPEAVEFGDLRTMLLQIEDLRVDEIRSDDEQERKGEEDCRAPVPTWGKHDGMVA